MLRCAIALSLALAATLPAHAQRVFQQNALRGELVITQPPEVLLNGKPARLAPSVRIRNPSNLIQLSGSLLGQQLVVNYTLDTVGELRDVWILTDAEAAKKPWPTTPEQAQSWVFDATLQTWRRP
jgi:hypothetical protein